MTRRPIDYVKKTLLKKQADANMAMASRFFAAMVPGGWAQNESPVTTTRAGIDECALMLGLASPTDSHVERTAARAKCLHHVNAGGRNRAMPWNDRFEVTCYNKPLGQYRIRHIADAGEGVIASYTGSVRIRGQGIIDKGNRFNAPEVLAALSPFDRMKHTMSKAVCEAFQSIQVHNAEVYGQLQGTFAKLGAILPPALAQAALPSPVPAPVNCIDNAAPQQD